MSMADAQIGVNTNLQKQDLNNLDVHHLTPLSPEVISRQATINIGTIGHVAHGKSTVVKAISGVQTVRFKNELERNITIKLERISYNFLQRLLNSPIELRKYEEREEERLITAKMKRKRSQSRSITPMRGNSSSPSSGYESINDNASTHSYDSISRKRERTSSTQSRDTILSNISKRRLLEQGPIETGNPSKKYKLTFTRKEYVVEKISSVESIHGSPVFYVKWLNYPIEQNTWESYDNLKECIILEDFIEKKYIAFEKKISNILVELKVEVKQECLDVDSSQINVQELDQYDYLTLKTDLILLAQFREAKSKNQRDTEKIRRRVVKSLLLETFLPKRKKQLRHLEAFKTQMNEIEVEAPINIENNVDFDVPDRSFVYIKENFAGKNVDIIGTSCVGCNCDGDCRPTSKCCGRMAGSVFPYEKNGKLRVRPGGAIFECNSSCSCGIDCLGRVIQRGRKNVLCIFKTSNGCGWGVRTERTIRRGEFVAEYVGEIITSDEANERGQTYDAIGRTYLFDLDYNTTAESLYTVDAGIYGNISHFINHSCNPNLMVYPFWINNLDLNMPRLAFFSVRSIAAGEELTFDYTRSDSDNAYKNLSKAEKVPCRCGADNCRKYLF